MVKQSQRGGEKQRQRHTERDTERHRETDVAKEINVSLQISLFRSNPLQWVNLF